MGRLLVGYAVGTITGIAPVFGAEIAKVRNISPTSIIKTELLLTLIWMADPRTS